MAKSDFLGDLFPSSCILKDMFAICELLCSIILSAGLWVVASLAIILVIQNYRKFEISLAIPKQTTIQEIKDEIIAVATTIHTTNCVRNLYHKKINNLQSGQTIVSVNTWSWQEQIPAHSELVSFVFSCEPSGGNAQGPQSGLQGRRQTKVYVQEPQPPNHFWKRSEQLSSRFSTGKQANVNYAGIILSIMVVKQM